MTFPRSLLLASALAFAAIGRAEDCTILLPPFVDGDGIAVVAPHDPALAADAELAGAVAALGGRCSVATAVAWIEASALPPIARERLLTAVAARAAASGTVADLDALAVLAAAMPAAVYEHPGCRRPESHAWFDYAEGARQAIRSIHFRDGEAAYSGEPESSRSDGVRLASLMASGADPEKVAGFFAAALRSIVVPGKFVDAAAMQSILAGHAQVRGRASDAACDAALIREAERADRADLLAVMAKDLPPSSAAEAIRAFDRVRATSTTHDLMALWRDGTETAVLAALDERDDVDGVHAYLAALLDDERLGADAARALVRISASRAAKEALAVLGSDKAAPVARRRAVLMLMDEAVPGGRDGLREWASGKNAESDPAMREEVVRWLAQ